MRCTEKTYRTPAVSPSNSVIWIRFCDSGRERRCAFRQKPEISHDTQFHKYLVSNTLALRESSLAHGVCGKSARMRTGPTIARDLRDTVRCSSAH